LPAAARATLATSGDRQTPPSAGEPIVAASVDAPRAELLNERVGGNITAVTAIPHQIRAAHRALCECEGELEPPLRQRVTALVQVGFDGGGH